MEVELVAGDVLDLDSLRAAVEGVDAVVHLVAIIREKEATFEEVNVQGVRNLLEACGNSQVHVVHVSALGTSDDSRSRYSRSKAEGERIMRRGEVPYVILRPALILGGGGDFTGRLGSLVAHSRKVPVVGSGENLLQPIYVGDVVKALVAALDSERGRIWNLLGPDRVSWNELVRRVARVLGVKRSLRHVPLWLARLVAKASSMRRAEPIVTEDELLLMRVDVCGGTEDFVELTGQKPMGLDESLTRSLRP